jgi:hypothetical protein
VAQEQNSGIEIITLDSDDESERKFNSIELVYKNILRIILKFLESNDFPILMAALTREANVSSVGSDVQMIDIPDGKLLICLCRNISSK